MSSANSERVINSNVSVTIKDAASARIGSCSERHKRLRRTFPRIAFAIDLNISFFEAALLAFDVYTDVDATLALYETEHYWWAGLMLVFIILPYLVAGIGVLHYVRNDFNRYCCCGDRGGLIRKGVPFQAIRNNVLEVLDVRDADLDNRQFKYLMETVANVPNPRLRQILLPDNAEHFKDSIEEILKTLRINDRLSTFTAGDVDLAEIWNNKALSVTTNGAQILAVLAVAERNGLESQLRSIHAKHIKPEYIPHLSKFLMRSDSFRLNNLSLRSSYIRDHGARMLSRTLALNSSLRWLDLSENSIGDNGAVALGKALRRNKSLQELKIKGFEWGTGIKIGSAGATALAKSLQMNKTLRRLDLSDNRIEDMGATAFAESLQVNRSLQVLRLSGNLVGSEGAKKLKLSLAENTTLLTIHLEDNDDIDYYSRVAMSSVHGRRVSFMEKTSE
eukprot:g5148.t1